MGRGNQIHTFLQPGASAPFSTQGGLSPAPVRGPPLALTEPLCWGQSRVLFCDLSTPISHLGRAGEVGLGVGFGGMAPGLGVPWRAGPQDQHRPG